MRIYLEKIFLLIIISFLFNSELIIAPLFHLKYNSQGSVLKYEKNHSTLGGWGFIAKYEFDKINIHLDFYNNRIYNINEKPLIFNNQQGLSWFKRVNPSNNPNDNTFDFDVTNLKVLYKINNLNLFFGKFNTHWGYGKSSLTLSNKSPSYPNFGFNFKLNENTNFYYIHGFLKSNLIDSLSANYYNQDIFNGARYPNINRYFAGHRIEFKPNRNFKLGINEIIIYGYRSLDIYYCLPFIPFWSIQHYLGDLDNLNISFDFQYKLNSQNHLYGTIFIDEWNPSKTFSKNNSNWFGYQVGFNLSKLIFKNDNFIAEFNWTDHRIYRHRYEINNFYNHDYPVGFWGGPHSQEIYLNYSFFKKDFLLKIEYTDAKRGLLTEEMLINQYTNNNDNFLRYGDFYEKISNLELSIKKNIYRGLFLNCGINFINWKNAGFDNSGLNNTNLIDIKKESLFFGLSYNYDFEKQKSFIHENSYKFTLK